MPAPKLPVFFNSTSMRFSSLSIQTTATSRSLLSRMSGSAPTLRSAVMTSSPLSRIMAKYSGVLTCTS